MIVLTQIIRFMLVGLVSPYEHQEKMIADFEELESLVRTYGGQVYAVAKQNSARKDQATFIGTGKAQEVADKIAEEKIDIVVVNANIKPGQLYTLKKIFERSNPNIIVWDKIDLILHLFAQHARTAEAKLQIKFALVRHMGPRIYGMGMELSRQAGGINTKGIGETNTELMERHWRQETRNIEKQLKKLSQSRQLQIDRRSRSDLFTVSIVGYTNSGKTTLFNALTGKNNFVDNILFATLDSVVGKFHVPDLEKEIILSDTIGFIQGLPPHLIHAFKSTLLEAIHARLILHVIDASDPWMDQKIDVVEKILEELRINTKNQIYVFNKIDKAKTLNQGEIIEKYGEFYPQFISADKKTGIIELQKEIQRMLISSSTE